MAEFQEVMRQWARMCKSMQEKNMSCKGNCLLGHNPTCGELEYASLEEINNAETVIMKWAAEHPVVYPTWIEWLKSMGIIPYLDGRVVKHDYDDNYLNGHVNVNEIIFKPISKDVAEKLGIEPKEG